MRKIHSIKTVQAQVIEFADVQEIDNCTVAMNDTKLLQNDTKYVKSNYTHCEIHPSFLKGIASIIPFSDHNQSPETHIRVLWVNRQVSIRLI